MRDAALLKHPAEIPGLKIEWHLLHELAQQYGSSFYLLDLNRVETNCKDLIRAFTSHYAQTEIAYSVKTNYTPRICQHLRSLGTLAEVVSETEYLMALRFGFSPTEIVVNGPLHEPDFVARALLQGSRFNIDSWYMLDILADIVREHPSNRIQVGVRLNFPCSEAEPNRFGFDATSQVIGDLRARIDEIVRCEIVGIHSHTFAPHGSLSSLKRRAEDLVACANRYFADCPLEYVDAGGAFHGKLPASLAEQIGGPVDGIEEYAQAVAGTVERGFRSWRRPPTLLIEPGSALVADAMHFVCEVYDLKSIGDRRYALVNGSMHNINYTRMWPGLRPPWRMFSSPHAARVLDAPVQPVALGGNTCIDIDLLAEGVEPHISPGDFVVFDYAGGYSNVLKQPFIHGNPPILCDYNGKLELVKRRDTIDDILRPYVE